ncbi:hypothetical protein J3F83DRAFT_737423 [Trichoderma novae-zelandiae]
MPPQTRRSSTSPPSFARANTINTSSSRNRHTQTPNNVPNPQYQNTNQPTSPFSYTPRTPPPRPKEPRRRGSLASRIIRHLSRAWKSFKNGSLANDDRYEYTLIRTRKKRHAPRSNTRLSTQASSQVPRRHRHRRRHHSHHIHRTPLPQPQKQPQRPRYQPPYPNSSTETLMPVATPVSNHELPSTPGLPPWRRPNLPSLQPATLPLSYFCRVTPYQPGQTPTVQSPYYFQVHLPDDQTASPPPLEQQEQQSPLTPNHLVSPYSLYRP